MRAQAETVERIADLPGGEWDALDASGNPFLRYAFLEALESTGSVGPESGWQPHHLIERSDAGRLSGAVPCYIKSHSWGEFVFDWNWARSCAQAGLDYYPKLVSAVPFTPVTGSRLLVGRDGGVADRRRLASQLRDTAQRLGAPVAQANFVTLEDAAALHDSGFAIRHDCRFLWHNRGYRDFEDFLARFRSEKRKKVRSERRRLSDAGITFESLTGGQITRDLWGTVFGFSEQTFLRHGHTHYLTAGFFETVARRMPDAIVVKLALDGREPIAAAVFFQDGNCLYGRYWGASRHVDCLHFEACYYQGIEWCIERGLETFDPGTQGEHKLARGFEPTVTRSAHWFAHDGLAAAIGRYLERERAAVDEYIAAAATHLPFQRGAAV